MNELSKTRDYDIVVVGKQIDGSDKVVFIQSAKENEALKKAGLSGQRYIHVQISEPVQIVNGKRTTRGLAKPKTTVIFESAHSKIFDAISEEILEERTKTFKSDPTKMELTDFVLSGKWIKRGTGFLYKLFRIVDGKVETLTSTVRVINDDGTIGYKVQESTNDMVEFFLHDQDLENEEEFVRKEVERLKPFAVQGQKIVTDADIAEKTEPVATKVEEPVVKAEANKAELA